MNGSKSTNDKQLDETVQGLLEVRQFAIGLTKSTERLLETMGYPVESAVRTRKERRGRNRGS